MHPRNELSWRNDVLKVPLFTKRSHAVLIQASLDQDRGAIPSDLGEWSPFTNPHDSQATSSASLYIVSIAEFTITISGTYSA